MDINASVGLRETDFFFPFSQQQFCVTQGAAETHSWNTRLIHLY